MQRLQKLYSLGSKQPHFQTSCTRSVLMDVLNEVQYRGIASVSVSVSVAAVTGKSGIGRFLAGTTQTENQALFTRIVTSFLSTRSSFLSVYTVTMLLMSTCLLKKLDDDDDDDDEREMQVVLSLPSLLFAPSVLPRV